jgi:hypothetical protein
VFLGTYFVQLFRTTNMSDGLSLGDYYFSTQGTCLGGKFAFDFCFGFPSKIAIVLFLLSSFVQVEVEVVEFVYASEIHQ